MTQKTHNPIKPALNRKAIAGRAGFTLVELLVASAGGLILMGFVAVVFSFYGRTVSENQAIIRMHDSMRSAAWKLRQDLEGITCDVKPWIRPEQDAGYFELIEGPLTDQSAAAGSTNLVADVDDVLMFTTRGNGSGFIGKHASSTMEADAAEVAWFCVQQPGLVDGMNLYSLHRRQLLVVGYVATADFLRSASAGDSLSGSYPVVSDDYDISMRMEGGRWRANGLSDLTKRENRFLHSRNASASFPFEVDLANLQTSGAFASSSSRFGEDVVIQNVLAFDVRVFDPQQAAVGYVDLGSGGAGLTGSMSPNSQISGSPTYCTWSYHYEFNGLDEDQATGGWRVGADQGTNLLDDDGNGAVDDSAELETAPPYNMPLRGIEIRLRCYEPQGKQIRQVTIRHAF
jgi:type II secretory pathway component PulJ